MHSSRSATEARVCHLCFSGWSVWISTGGKTCRSACSSSATASERSTSVRVSRATRPWSTTFAGIYDITHRHSEECFVWQEHSLAREDDMMNFTFSLQICAREWMPADHVEETGHRDPRLPEQHPHVGMVPQVQTGTCCATRGPSSLEQTSVARC